MQRSTNPLPFAVEPVSAAVSQSVTTHTMDVKPGVQLQPEGTCSSGSKPYTSGKTQPGTQGGGGGVQAELVTELDLGDERRLRQVQLVARF